MKDLPEKTPPLRELHFKKGDLILKEGDYGISIYKVNLGKVGIFMEAEDREIGLAVLGPGEVIGEMTFLHGGTLPRSASVRALEDTTLEIWHPMTLAKEYESAPPMIKYIVNHVLNRLLRMNTLVGKLGGKVQKKEPAPQEPGFGTSQRQYYRKGIDRPCTYRPLKTEQKVTLEGQIKDLSFNGAGMEINVRDFGRFKYDKGDEFYVHLLLSPEKEVKFIGRLVHMKEHRTSGRVFLGLEISDIDNDSRKTLGFFLMP